MTTVSQKQVVVETEDKQDNLLRLPYFVSVEQLSADDVLHQPNTSRTAGKYQP